MPSEEASDNDETYLVAEVDRAISETRLALGDLAKQLSLPPSLMCISTLIDRITVELTLEEGDSAFQLRDEEKTVVFRAGAIRHILREAELLADEVGVTEPSEVRRIGQVAINLFIVHELLHIRQNFPDFATVSKIKEGLGGIGLPMLDVAADTVAAWVAANVEAQRLGLTSDNDILHQYANALILSYVIAAFVYDGRTKPEKRQRVLGLVIEAVLVQAKADGMLDESEIYDSWNPMSPVLALNAERSGFFNAIVIDRTPGLLLKDSRTANPEQVREFWRSAGVRPVARTLSLAAKLLMQMKALRRA